MVGGATLAVPDASADSLPDNAVRYPARAVTLSGTPHCKNVCSNGRAARQTTRNNPAEHSAIAENLRSQQLGAGLRTTPTQQLTPVALPRLRLLLAPYLPALVRLLLMHFLLEVTPLGLAR